MNSYRIRRIRKMEKSNYYLYLSDCLSYLSARMKQLGSHWTDFREI